MIPKAMILWKDDIDETRIEPSRLAGTQIYTHGNQRGILIRKEVDSSMIKFHPFLSIENEVMFVVKEK